MRISNQQIQQLKNLLNEQLSLMYTDEEAQQAGLAIMRFVLAEERKVGRLNKVKLNQRNRDEQRP